MPRACRGDCRRTQRLVRDGTLFHDSLSWNVTPGINVLLGRNDYGKTLLLRNLLALLQYADKIAQQTLGNGSATISILRKGR